MATMKDIARETGLGLATISKYLNGGNVRPENKALLDAAIEKYQFKINETARSLKTNKSKIIGIVIPELSNTFLTTIITEMDNYLRQHGYGVMVTDCRSDESREKEAIDFMLSRNVDGLVHMPMGVSGAHLATVSARHVPIVLVDRKIKGFNYVGVDNVEAGKVAATKLIENGHKNIGIITGPNHLSTAVERLTGYIEALSSAGIAPNPSYIFSADYTIECGYERMKEILENPAGMTAVIVTNYEMTVGAMIAINEKSVQIPNELSFVGFDNLVLSKAMNPKLTIVAQPVADIAVQASQMLLDIIDKKEVEDTVVLSPFLEEGTSISKI